ncbi:MAG: class I SAM-dependent methyltransferase [Armatimonadetes bacterium]|nr:class I SAM-dependent methyltransferase [Armatimonadota bacterium]
MMSLHSGSLDPAREISPAPYHKIVLDGLYSDKAIADRGKNDHVFRSWELPLTRHFLKPHVVEWAAKEGRHPLRILDLGCGTGEGYELLAEIERFAANRGIEYHGLDLNEAMIAEGRYIRQDLPEVHFHLGDMRCDIPWDSVSSGFDVVFCSFGSLSHLNREDMKQLLIHLVSRNSRPFLFVGDWLGEYSYEWQDYWGKSPWRDYCMSYFEFPHRRNGHIAPIRKCPAGKHFPMQFWSRKNLVNLVKEVAAGTSAKLVLRECFDRSILVGRHMDTGEYNRNARPLRRWVNHLFNPAVRTPLENLYFRYSHEEGFHGQNVFFAVLEIAWNYLVGRFQKVLEPGSSAPSWAPNICPPWNEKLAGTIISIEEALFAMSAADLTSSRECLMEPLLAYGLRAIEGCLQEGTGYGHGFLSVIEVGCD